MEIEILLLTEELIQNSNQDNATKKMLYANIGRYIAAEASERGWVFFHKTLSETVKTAQAKWDKLERQ